MTPISIACESNNLDIVKRLLKEPELDFDTLYRKNRAAYSPLGIAILKGNYHIAKALLKDPRTDVNGIEIL